MAFCGNCGAQIPEGMKFCSECGTELVPASSTYVQKPSGSSARNNVVRADEEPKQNRSVPWMVVSIVALLLSIYGWFVESPITTIIVSFVGLALAIVALVKKAKFRAIAIIAIVLSGLMLILWGFQGAIDQNNASKSNTVSQAPEQPTRDLSEYAKGENYSVVPKTRSEPITSTSTDELEESTETVDDSMLDTGGVDPDLKAFLDSYEDFMDEYIEFMQEYMNNPTDMALLGQYADMLQKCSDFEEKADKYDSDSMSTADAAYYLEVTNRINQKMLKVYSN